MPILSIQNPIQNPLQHTLNTHNAYSHDYRCGILVLFMDGLSYITYYNEHEFWF